MSGLIKKIKGAFSSPSPTRKAKSTGDLSAPQIYVVKEKELPKLHFAAWKGNLDKVMELSRPDKLNSVDKDGRTPLHLAVAADNIPVVEHLLSEDAKLQILDRESKSPLIIASLRGNPKMMEILLNNLDQKSLVNLADKNGLNPLLYAVKTENIQVLKVLLAEKSINLDFQDKDRNTALHYASIQKKIEAIDLLIDNGADIDAQNADGRTPLMLAAQIGDEELIDYLLDYGPDKLVKDKTGMTAINLAEMSRNKNCVNLFKENRPVKPNTSHLSRVKRSLSQNERSTADLPTGQSSTDGNKKFDNLFAGKGVSAKYKTQDGESDTSKILSEENGGKMVLSHNKSDKNTWNDSDNDTDSLSYSHEANSKKNTPKTNKFESMFANIEIDKKEQFDIDIDIYPDNQGDANWMFQTPKRNENNNEVNNKTGEFHALGAILTGEMNDDAPNWSIYTYTSNIKSAGTDAKVYLQIFGSRANTGKLNLEKKSKNENPFESGKCDRFDKRLPDIGKPTKIKIGHDNSGSFAGWHLEKVVIENNITNEKYVFPCNRWLAKDEADHKIELELYLNGNSAEGKQTTSKLRDSWNSASSWNSSEEDDSLGGSNNNKKTPYSPARSITNLNQIEEESSKLNETNFSKTSRNSRDKDRKTEHGPPEISDLEESIAEDKIGVNKNRKSNSPPNESALAFLVKKNLPKNASFEIPGTDKNETVKKLLNKSANDIEKSVNFDMDSDFGGIWSETSNKNKSNQLQKQNFSFESNDVDSKISNFSPRGDQIDKKIFNKSMQKNKNKVEKNFLNVYSDSDTEDKSHSIGDLINQFNQIKTPPKVKKSAVKSDQESSIEFLVKNNLPVVNNGDSTVKGSALSELIRNEKKETKKIVDKDSFDKSESLDELEDMFNKIKTKPPSAQVKQEEMDNPLKVLIKNNPPPGFNDSSEGFMLHSPSKRPDIPTIPEQPESALANLIRNDSVRNQSLNKSNDKSDTNSSDSLQKPANDSKNQTIGSLVKAFSPTKTNSQAEKLNKSGNRSGGLADLIRDIKSSKEFEDSSENEDESSFKHDEKDIYFNSTGTIGAAVGAVIVGGSVGSPISSPVVSVNRPTFSASANRDKPSFVSILPELFDAPNVSPRKSYDSFKQDDLTSDLLNKLREKNNELEKAKMELENRLKEAELQKKKFEIAFNNSDKLLAEKERYITNIEKFKNETNKSELNDIKQLRKEISDLKEDKHALENKLTIMQTTAAAAAAISANGSLRSSEDFAVSESLNIKVKALENQIEELNKDRKILSSCKEELTCKLDESENEIKKRSEALQIAIIQFNMEKKMLSDENGKAKKELNDLNELRKKLNEEIDNLKLQLNEKNLNYERLNIEKINYEKQYSREKEDREKFRGNYESEMNLLKEQQLKLMEKLGSAEAKLISTEKDVRYHKAQIEERQKQIDDLKEQLSKSKSEYALQLNLFKKEKEEKERLLERCEKLEADIKKNTTEISELKQNQHKQAVTNLHTLPPAGPSSSSNHNDSNDTATHNRLVALEKENSKLHGDMKNLIDKLQKTENELEKYRINAELEKLNATKERSNKTLDSNVIQEDIEKSNENTKLRMEVQKLRNDFNLMLNKYSSLDNLNGEMTSTNPSLLKTTHYTPVDKYSDIMFKRDQVDVPALITDLPLKTIATLNNYLIKNIIAQEQQTTIPDLSHQTGLETSNLFQKPQPHIVIAKGGNLYSLPNDTSPSYLGAQTQGSNCKKCSTHTNNAYIELLKHELSKRIELQVAKDTPFSSAKLTSNLDLNYRNTNNYDSLYNTFTQNSRYSNTDLLNSLRSKFLI